MLHDAQRLPPSRRQGRRTIDDGEIGQSIFAKANALQSRDFGMGIRRMNSPTLGDESSCGDLWRPDPRLGQVERRCARMKSSISAFGPVSQAMGSPRHAVTFAVPPTFSTAIGWTINIPRQSLVKDWNQRRALSPSRNICGPKIIRDRQSEPLCQCFAVTDLYGQSRCRTVQYRLSVEADNGHVRFSDLLCFKEGLDGFGVNTGHKCVRFGQHARTLLPVRQFRALHERLPQQMPLRVGIWPVTRRPKAGDAFAISFNQRHVDTVERRPAHQPDRPDHPQHRPLL